MNKILVPIDQFSPLSLSAAYFAVEFAKRNPTRILFLIFLPTSEGIEADNQKIKSLPKPFSDLMQEARTAKITLDLFFSSEDFWDTIPRFSRDHHISEIILALPQADDPQYESVKAYVEGLRTNVGSQIVIVRPKETASSLGEKGLEQRPSVSVGKSGRTILIKERK